MKAWIRFEVVEEKPKTKVWEVISNYDGFGLGKVYWYPKWRQYIFESFDEKIWSDECLKELYDFLCKLKAERKSKTSG